MGQKRPPTEANQELSTWLVEQGYPTTPREVRTWRDNEWIAKAIVEPQGYAQPTKTSNPPEVFPQAKVVAEVRAGRRTSPNVMVLRLFMRDHRVPLEQLRTAVLWSLQKVQDEIDQALEASNSPNQSPAEIVGAVAAGEAHKSRSGRRMLRGAKGGEGSAPAVVGSAMTFLADVLMGGGGAEYDLGGNDALDELIDVTSLRGLAEDQVANVGAIVPGGRDELRADLQGFFSVSSLAQIEEEVISATYDEFERSRDIAIPVLDLCKAMVANLRRADPSLKDAFGLDFIRFIDSSEESVALLSALFLPQVRRIGVDVATASVDELTQTMEQQGAINKLYAVVPPHLHKYLGAAGNRRLEKASDTDRVDLRDALRKFEADNPGSLRTARPDQ